MRRWGGRSSSESPESESALLSVSAESLLAVSSDSLDGSESLLLGLELPELLGLLESLPLPVSLSLST